MNIRGSYYITTRTYHKALLSDHLFIKTTLLNDHIMYHTIVVYDNVDDAAIIVVYDNVDDAAITR